MTDITHIPLDQIDADALPRDRTAPTPEADTELWQSISNDGLRQPIEVFPVEGDTPFALISGHRRLTAFRTLAERNAKNWTTIPAFIRTPETIPEAMANMIAENEIRAQISPWDRARTIVDAVHRGSFETYDAAIATLHPRASTQKNSRLRTLVSVVFHYYDAFKDPHTLSERKLLRLATLQRAGLDDLAQSALAQHRPTSTDAAWQLLAPIIDEAEQVLAGNTRLQRPRAPRRRAELAQGLHIRREFRPDGWALIMTGPRADGIMVQEVMDDIIWKLSAPD